MGLIGLVILSVFGAVFLGILAGILMHRIIGLYITGNISCLQCIVLTGMFLAFLMFFITVPSMGVRITMGVLLLILLISLPFLGKLLAKNENRRYYDSRIEEYRNAIIADPQNLAARSRLAQSLHKEGRLDEAIQELSEYVRLAPQDIAEARLLNQLIQEQEERQSPPITCPSCGHKNSPDRTRCESCESRLSMASEFRKWLVKGGMKEIVISTAITMAVITGILLALSAFSTLGRILIISLIIFVFLLMHMIRIYRNI